jgi:hypothetical protein
MTCDVSRRSRVAVRNEKQNEEALGGGGPAGCGVTGWLPWRVPVTALVWALTAAVLYGTGAALQQRQAAATPSQAAGRPRLLLLLVRRPWWLLGIGVELGGFAAHAVALRTGPLTIVQMLIASSLLFSVATVRLWSGRRLSWTAWAAVLAVIAGITSFVALTSSAGDDAGVPGGSGHAGLAAACLATCAVPLAAAGLAAAGSRRAVLLAMAAGLADAGIAFVTMAFSHVVSGGLTGMAGSWATYALMLGGPCSLLLTQTAYQPGRPMITLPVIAVVTPVASVAAGNLLLGESAQLGVLSGAVAALAVLVTSAGLVVLARLTTGQPATADGQRSSVTMPAFPASGSRSGPGPGPADGVPAARPLPHQGRPEPGGDAAEEPRASLAGDRVDDVSRPSPRTRRVAAFRGLPANRYRRDLAGRPLAGRGLAGWRVAAATTVQLMRASTVIDSMVSDSVTYDAEIDSWKPKRPTRRLMMRAPSVAAV